mgnify:CR=1 FL=1
MKNATQYTDRKIHDLAVEYESRLNTFKDRAEDMDRLIAKMETFKIEYREGRRQEKNARQNLEQFIEALKKKGIYNEVLYDWDTKVIKIHE